MNAEYVMALDAGTGSCRAILFDSAGRQIAAAAREWVNSEVPSAPGSQQFSTSDNWQLICDCIHECLATGSAEARSVKAVAATSMREGIVLYDRHGREIWACPNADARAGEQASRLIGNGAAQRIYEISGDWVSITSTPRLLWLAEHEPDLLRSVRHLGMLSDWINYRLCGEFCTEPSAGSSSGMFDLAARTWSPEIVAISGLAPEILPEVLPCGSVLGKVTAVAAEETGLAPGTPVVLGGADTQVGLHGLAAAPGEITIIGGTFWQQTALTRQPIIDPKARLRTLCHVSDDEWMIEGIGFYSGLALRWFRDAFCRDLVIKARADGQDPYRLIEAEAATAPPGSDGVIPIFGNVMKASNWTHAAPSFLQFDLTRPETGRAACARALLEHAAYTSLAHVEILGELTGRACASIRFAGGASAGTLWPQILADVLGCPVITAPISEASAYGTMLLAARGIGVPAGTVPMPQDREYLPNLELRASYQESYARWAAVNAALLQLTESLDLQPLWRAPGGRPGNQTAEK